jgi:hypothetical protein
MIDGQVTYPGRQAEGTLLNSRMVQAIWDAENYDFDEEANVQGFIDNLPNYAAKGLNMVTVGLQGGLTGLGSAPKSTAFNADGSLKDDWMNRLDRVIEAALANGIIVEVQLFYRTQDHYIATDNAVTAAVNNVVDWLATNGYTEAVLFEVANESNVDLFSDHPILQPDNIHQLITQAKNRSGGKLLVSTSINSGSKIPPDSIIRASDYVLLHGNGTNPARLKEVIDTVRGRDVYISQPKPILVNEDSTSTAQMDAALSKGVGWGYYDQEGFQNIPANWGINTPAKTNFFNKVQSYAGRPTAPPSPAPTESPLPSPTPQPSPPLECSGTTVTPGDDVQEKLKCRSRWSHFLL